MIALPDLLALAGADLTDAQHLTGSHSSTRTRVTGYEGLKDLDVLDGAGTRIFLRGDDVVLIYVGEAALPDGTTSDDLAALVDTDGQELPSRQGKNALIHVVAERGLAWSEEGGEIGFVELFPPTTFETYHDDIYVDPGTFSR